MNPYVQQLDAILPTGLTGTVMESDGATVAVAGFPAPVGAVARIETTSADGLPAEVIGFRDQWTLVSPIGALQGVRRGQGVRIVQT